MSLTSEEARILDVLANTFYSVVPSRLQTYCAATSAIAVRALRSFGMACDLLPCQLWYTAPGRNIVIGFLGHEARPHVWDGHVICAGKGWYVDAAVHHLKAQFDVPAPRLIGGLRFDVPTQAIARHDLSPTERIWWHHAPTGVDATPPAEPEAVVNHHAGLLVAAMRQQLAKPVAYRANTPAASRAGDAARAVA